MTGSDVLVSRIFLSSLYQETNTFCPNASDLDNFERGHCLRGGEILDLLSDTNTEIAGLAAGLADDGRAEAIPGVAAWAGASGRLRTRAFEQICSDLLGSLKAAGPVDGVALALHGALMSEESDDCEGQLLRQVRALVGSDVPIVCTLDYHALVTDAMAAHADLLIGYRTYPHVDFAQTGRRAAGALLRLIREQPDFQTVMDTLAVILPVDNTETGEGPMAEVIRALEETDRDPEVLGASVFCPHPWLDVPSPHLTVLFHTTGPAAGRCRRSARRILDGIWQRRAEFLPEALEVPEFLDRFDEWPRPCVVVDSGDITSAGGVGDSTVILRALLRSGRATRTVLTIVDPAAVAVACQVGQGNVGEFCLGGGVDYGYNAPVRVTARVAHVGSGPVTLTGPSLRGLTLDTGRRVRLDVDREIHVILTEHTSLMHDPGVLRDMGIDPGRYELIVQKSHKLFRAAYRDIAESVVTVDTPGFTVRDVRSLPFKNVKRPIYPLDDLTAPAGRGHR